MKGSQSNHSIRGFIFLFCFHLMLLLVLSAFPFLKVSFGEEDSSGSDSKKDQIRQIESDLSREKEQFLKYDSKEKKLLEQLSNIEKAIEEKRAILKDLQDKIRASKKQLKIQQDQLDQIERSLSENEDLLYKRLEALYKYSKRGYLQILSTANDLGQLNNRIKYLKVILKEDFLVMKQISDKLENYHKKISQTQKRLELIAIMEEEEQERLSSIKHDLEEKVILLARIHKEKEFYKTAVQELQLAAENLKQTVINIEKKRIEEKELPSGFAEKRGKLPLPVKGKVMDIESEPGLNKLKTYNGIYINSTYGEDVRAVFPGRIDYANQLKGYGHVVVINHGSRFFTISTNLSSIAKRGGEMVLAGDIIGQIGETGLTIGPGLYFEIRQGGKSLDPLKWLKVN